MKTIGLIGGLTWVSTIEYYRALNEITNEKRGGHETAEVLMFSVNFGEIKKLTEANDWDGLAALMRAAAKRLEDAGADCLMISANTMHKIYDEVQPAVTIPIFHIADAAARAITKLRLKKVALLGTKYTMQLPFYSERLARHQIETVIPEGEDIETLNLIIYNELGKNLLLPESKQFFLDVIKKMVDRGAEGIILGCTEIPLLIKPSDCQVPVFDTAFLHAEMAVEFALG